MSAIRYIGIYILIVTLISQSSSLSVVALSEEDMVVNSLSALEIPAEITEDPISTIVTVSSQKQTTPEVKMMTIADLLRENALYAKSQSDTITPPEISDASIRENIIMSLDTKSVFGDFLIENQPTKTLLSGYPDARIRLDRSARKEQKIAGVKGSIAVNMATGTIISTSSGDLIDPSSIGIFTAGSLEQMRSKEYHGKKIKSQKSKK